MDIKTETMQYLNNNTFIPHKGGNYANYGLNLFGCNSIIQYNNNYWKFIWFLSNSNNAVYINKNGEELVINYKIEGAIRMQQV
jgi:hypothetical protein